MQSVGNVRIGHGVSVMSSGTTTSFFFIFVCFFLVMLWSRPSNPGAHPSLCIVCEHPVHISRRVYYGNE